MFAGEDVARDEELDLRHLGGHVARPMPAFEVRADMVRRPPMPAMTQCMVRPCVARRFRRIGGGGLASMYPPLIGACCAPGHHGYQRAYVLISGRASIGPFGSPVFARARKTDPPFCLILSQTSAGNC